MVSEGFITCVRLARSLPARSTKWNLELTSSSGAGWGSVGAEEEEEEEEEEGGAGCCCARIFWSTCTVKIAWLLLRRQTNTRQIGLQKRNKTVCKT
jgi:hypothetical protein